MFAVNREEALKWLDDTDGYSVMLPEFFEKILPPQIIEALTMDHAGGEGKYAVSKGGSVLETCIGISEFMAVNSLAKLLEVEPCREYLGRGKNFRITRDRCVAALRQPT